MQGFSQDTCYTHHCPSTDTKALPQRQHPWPSEWKQKNEGREGWTRDSVAELLPSTSAMGFLPRTVKLTGGQRVEPGRRNPIFIAVCTVRQRQVNAAPRAAPCPVQTDDVAHQLSRAGTCSLIRAGSTLQRHLFPRYHSTLQKEQKKRPGQSLPQSVGIICPQNQLCDVNPIPVYLHPTPTHVNHEHQGC